ncbi:MAG: hypothetical protein GX629_07515 [Phycisphaerae bacterium]|jgi:hypothetical protein|nr:hypothetical protein [Phycisphaerae bacterium]
MTFSRAILLKTSWVIFFIPPGAKEIDHRERGIDPDDVGAEEQTILKLGDEISCRSFGNIKKDLGGNRRGITLKEHRSRITGYRVQTSGKGE